MCCCSDPRKQRGTRKVGPFFNNPNPCQFLKKESHLNLNFNTTTAAHLIKSTDPSTGHPLSKAIALHITQANTWLHIHNNQPFYLYLQKEKPQKNNMSLYYEAASVLTSSSAPSAHVGGSLKSRVFGSKDLKSPPAQVYALALESCKWSALLKEVIENSQLLQAERKVCLFLLT